MNIRTIRDMLVEAVRLDRETHEHIGPAKLRGQQLPYLRTEDDMLNWGYRAGDRRSTDPKANACRLRLEDYDAYSIFRQEFWEQFHGEPTAEEIARAEKVHGWIMLVDKLEDRRALLGWLKSKAGGKAFRRWCFAVEGISQKTGLKRKDRALAQICAVLSGSDALHDVTASEGGLPIAPEFGDLFATIAAGADESEGLNNWAAADAKPDIEIRYESDRSGNREVAVPASDFTWAAKQNARRRQREAERRKKEAA